VVKEDIRIEKKKEEFEKVPEWIMVSKSLHIIWEVEFRSFNMLGQSGRIGAWEWSRRLRAEQEKQMRPLQVR